MWEIVDRDVMDSPNLSKGKLYRMYVYDRLS